MSRKTLLFPVSLKDREVRTLWCREESNSGERSCLILEKSSCSLTYECLPKLIKLYAKARTAGLLHNICLNSLAITDIYIFKAKETLFSMARMVGNDGRSVKIGCFNQ